MRSNHIPQPASTVIARTLEDGTVLVSTDTGMVRVLNELGSVIWQQIQGKHTLEQIVAHVNEQYEVTAEQAWEDVETFLEELTERGLILWES